MLGGRGGVAGWPGCRLPAGECQHVAFLVKNDCCYRVGQAPAQPSAALLCFGATACVRGAAPVL